MDSPPGTETARFDGLTSIVILTRNQLEYTQQCVASLRRHTPEAVEIIVVDNGSTDGTVAWLHAQPDLVVLENGENLGFGGGCNQGMAIARGERILLLNNDTVVTAGWLRGLHDALDADPVRGIVGPRSNEIAGSQRVDDVAYDQDTLAGLDEFAADWCGARAGQGSVQGRVVGFCMLLRREVLDLVGGFDVRFGVGNFEDDDICLRAIVAGFVCWSCDDVFVHHFGSRTFRGERVDYTATMDANFLRFRVKWRMPEHAFDLVGRSYIPALATAGVEYERRRHYAPLVAVPDDDGVVRLERKGHALLVAADPERPEELREQFRACCATFGAADDVTVVVRVDPRAAQATCAVLEAVADELGADADLPDIAVVEASARNDEPLVRAADSVLVAGRTRRALAGLARLYGARAVELADLPLVLRPLRAVA